jgi:hypothetical protein
MIQAFRHGDSSAAKLGESTKELPANSGGVVRNTAIPVTGPPR